MAQELHFYHYGVWSTEVFFTTEVGHKLWQSWKNSGVARSIVDLDGIVWWRVKIEYF